MTVAANFGTIHDSKVDLQVLVDAVHCDFCDAVIPTRTIVLVVETPTNFRHQPTLVEIACVAHLDSIQAEAVRLNTV